MPLLEIDHLQTHFISPQGTLKAVDDVSLALEASQVLGIVGESGCGKSVLSLSILRLLPTPPAHFAGGAIRFLGTDLLRISNEAIRKIRGNRISMIFQEPMTALNPVFTIGDQLAEVFRVHWSMDRREARAKAVDMLRKVGVPAARRRVKEYPYQLSGGMRQRVMIAMALACRPALLIADEPTTALDVTIQAQILELMHQLLEELQTAIIMISHDLGVIAETADRVAVMYTGRIVEEASTVTLFETPLHPYTRGLMRAIPSLVPGSAREDLYEIAGVVPSLLDLPPGCPFNPRCPRAETICREKAPQLRELAPGHRVSCWMADHA